MKIEIHTFGQLEAALCEAAALYAANPDGHREYRDSVIAAKDRARFASHNQKTTELKRRIKAEMVEWMLVWLGDPALFEEWARLRRLHMDGDLLALESDV